MFRTRSLPESIIRYRQDDPPQGGGPSSPPPADPPANSSPGPEAAFQRLLERNNRDGIGLAWQLFNENHDYRQQNRQLDSQVRDLQGKVPGDDAVVLSGDDAKRWQRYQELELGDPDEVKQGLDQRTQLQEQVERAEREKTVRTVAEAAGYRPSVLMQLAAMEKAQGKDLAFEVKQEQRDGETVQVAYVKDGEAEKPLTDYASEAWSDFMPSLTAEPQGAQGATPETPAPTGPQGLRYPQQHPGSGNGKPKPLYEQFLEENNERAAKARNPLIKNET